MRIVKLTKEMVKENIKRLVEIDGVIEGDSWNIDNFLMDLEGKWDYSYVAVVDNEIVGFVICSIKGDALYVHRMGVLSEYQGKGVGGSLLEYIAELCQKEDMKHIILQVKKFSLKGQRFYESKKFSRVGDNGPNYVYIKDTSCGRSENTDKIDWKDYVHI